MHWLERGGRAALAAVLLLGLVVLVAACGGSDDEESSGSGSGTTTAEKPTKPITIASWGGSYSDATRDSFVKPWTEDGEGAGAKFVAAAFDMQAQTIAQARAGETQFDVFDGVDGNAGWSLYEKKLIPPLPEDVKAKMVEALGEEKVSPFGFSMGALTYVVVCNTKKVDPCPQNMAEFFDVEKFPQKRTVPNNDPSMMVHGASQAAGVDPKVLHETDLPLDEAVKVLDTIKPKVAAFWNSSDQQMQIMRDGTADLGIMYSPRAHQLRDEGVPLEIIWEGGIYAPGWQTVSRDADKDAAYSFLLSMVDHPERMAEWSQAIGGYSVPHPEAVEMIPEKVRKTLADYPANFEVAARSNTQWYLDNLTELNRAFEAFTKG